MKMEMTLETLLGLSPGFLLQPQLQLQLELSLMPVLELVLELVLVLLEPVPVPVRVPVPGWVPESVAEPAPTRSRSMVALTLEPTPYLARRSPAPRRPPDARKRRHRPSRHPTSHTTFECP